jgi:hypothetical protein
MSGLGTIKYTQIFFDQQFVIVMIFVDVYNFLGWFHYFEHTALLY